MLMRGDYPTEYVDAVRAMVAANVASYTALGLPEGNDFERGYVHQLLLALDSYFTHRGRGQEGKDGNPLNEVRMITDSLQGDDAHGAIVPLLAPNSTIKYKPENSVLGLATGDPLDLSVAEYEKLAVAFLDELEKKFPPR
ncbi:MAG: hypothetical protein ABIW17_07950 [Marmoricola sp.]